MADKRGEKVERWKLSPEQVEFQKKFKELRKVRNLLAVLSEAEKERMATLQGAWEQLQISYEGLAEEMPESALRKPQGMQWEDESMVRGPVERGPVGAGPQGGMQIPPDADPRIQW